jgi:lysophospholipase L1-like esterase
MTSTEGGSMRRHPFPSRALGAAAAALCGLCFATLPAPRALAQAAKPAESAPPAKAAPPTTMSPAEAITYAEQRREEWRKARTSIYFNDFGEVNRYRRANAQLKPPAPGERRVVFFGDSITDMWRIENSFPGKGYLNRGIGGQTTAQMLVRFREDVIALAPLAVVILAGTNDIAGNSGPMTLEETEANFTSMAELARLHNIRVIFSSVLPVHHYTARSDATFPLRPPEKIAELNRWLKSYCAANGHTYLDYVPATADDKGWLKRELAEDGLHPGPAGYALMAALAQAAIDKTLGAAPGAK